MSNKAEQYTQIEAFLAGSLPAAEEQQFQERISADPELRKEVALHKELASTFGDPDYLRLQELLREKRGGGKIRRPGFISRPGFWGLAAALLLLISAALLYFFSPNKEVSGPAIFADYYRPYSTDNFRDATSAEEAKQLTPAEVQFINSQELLREGKSEEALPILGALQQSGELAGLAQPISWYLALAQIGSNDFAAARRTLESIIAEGNHYQNAAAREILEKIP